jgi:hypothetical protein
MQSSLSAQPSKQAIAKEKHPDNYWKSKLTPLQYEVTRKQGTVPAFTREYANTKTDGIYTCICSVCHYSILKPSLIVAQVGQAIILESVGNTCVRWKMIPTKWNAQKLFGDAVIHT